ncbi:MAG: prefoldin subunit alpha [Methanomicrobia archaeon]|nr:prefoldin subunit alpha [Methanomicrobia archaeon]RLF93268.1 MAG: prefoldin subunit alpha [Thermococci archaeon]RLF99799.1 MAG: prefoldin subunit alpha [Thermococci archaeon]
MNKNDLLAKFAYLKEQGEIIVKNIAILEERLTETLIAKNTLEELKKVGKGELLVPIGGGCFIETELKNLDSVTINIGGGVSKEASVEESLSKLDENAENIRKMLMHTRENLSKIENDLAAVDKELRKQK